jgi:hypothetical protein
MLRRANAPNSHVLLIDTDSQAHATLVTTGTKDYGTDNSLYTVLMADRQNAAQTLLNCIVPSTWDADLHVLPASPMLEGAGRELWSPLVALAAYFEEQGGLVGLLDAISNAAEWDEQISEGKSLSEREEAVLQALEIMTRNQPAWIKATDLREQVRDLLGYPKEQMGHA